MRVPRIKKYVKILFWIVLVVFVILNMHILITFQPSFSEQGFQHRDLQAANNDLGHLIPNLENESIPQFIIPPNFFNSSGVRPRTTVDAQDLEAIKREILRINKEQFISNLHKFPLKLKSESVVIVIQVHDRGEYLKILLESLKQVEKIRNSLVIISHDVYSEEINKLVAEVDFCPVIQIFFPFSLQLYPNKFPGQDPKDCPRNMKKEEAMKKKCKNAHSPDKYGHYREARYCQTKHHWFWKGLLPKTQYINELYPNRILRENFSEIQFAFETAEIEMLHHVFDDIDVMKNYRGLVLLLEEDYYVTPDVITTLQMMWNLRNRDCKECKMLAAGNYDKNQNYRINAGKVEIANWISSRHNMGMTFTTDLWTEIKKCAKEFCNFDDYNWDWTLQHVSSKCIPNQVKVLKMKATRVFHMGECGVHHKGKNCKPEEKKKLVQRMIDNNKNHLFPNTVTIGSFSGLKLRDPKPNGGWGDKRDRQLCLSFLDKNSVGIR